MEITHKLLKDLVDFLNHDEFGNDDPHIPPLHSGLSTQGLPELKGQGTDEQLKGFLTVLRGINPPIPNRQFLDYVLKRFGVLPSRECEWWTELALRYLNLTYLERIELRNLPARSEIEEHLFLGGVEWRSKMALRALRLFTGMSTTGRQGPEPANASDCRSNSTSASDSPVIRGGEGLPEHSD